MEDVQIIDLFFRRDPAALEAVEARYGKKCLAAACHILPDRRDAEECVSDVWLRLWNAIPPERPRSLAAPASSGAWRWTAATTTKLPSAAAT